jgi:hypothetical protein
MITQNQPIFRYTEGDCKYCADRAAEPKTLEGQIAEFVNSNPQGFDRDVVEILRKAIEPESPTQTNPNKPEEKPN